MTKQKDNWLHVVLDDSTYKFGLFLRNMLRSLLQQMHIDDLYEKLKVSKLEKSGNYNYPL